LFLSGAPPEAAAAASGVGARRYGSGGVLVDLLHRRHGRPAIAGRLDRVALVLRIAPLLEDEHPLRLRHPAPDAVGLGEGERVLAARLQHRALGAQLLRPLLAGGAGMAAFAVGVEEHGRIDTAAQPPLLPFPIVD